MATFKIKKFLIPLDFSKTPLKALGYAVEIKNGGCIDQDGNILPSVKKRSDIDKSIREKTIKKWMTNNAAG